MHNVKRYTDAKRLNRLEWLILENFQITLIILFRHILLMPVTEDKI